MILRTTKLLSAVFLVVSLFSCAKEENSNFYSVTYRSDKGTTLTLTGADWYLTKNDIGGGNVNLRLTGSTNGDTVTVRTYGDGLISDENLSLDAKKEFNQDFVISFTAASVPADAFIAKTLLYVYKGADTLKVALESDYLKY